MADKFFEVTLVSKEGRIWEGKASLAQVPAIGGGLSFLPGHASALVLLDKGEMKVRSEKELSFAIEGGFASFDGGAMVVAVDSAKAD